MTVDELIEESLGWIGFYRMREIGDYAPWHATLGFLTRVLAASGRKFNDNRGWPRLYLRLLEEAKGMHGYAGGLDLLENDPWLPCYKCGVEVKPAIDKKLVSTYMRHEKDGCQDIELYLCNDCGGGITPLQIRTEKQLRYNEFPWEHEEYRYDLLMDED